MPADPLLLGQALCQSLPECLMDLGLAALGTIREPRLVLTLQLHPSTFAPLVSSISLRASIAATDGAQLAAPRCIHPYVG